MLQQQPSVKNILFVPITFISLSKLFTKRIAQLKQMSIKKYVFSHLVQNKSAGYTSFGLNENKKAENELIHHFQLASNQFLELQYKVDDTCHLLPLIPHGHLFQ